ncbi:MAG: hypothetical protein RJQ09_21270 [Cyclobacteriaceae bacterium]
MKNIEEKVKAHFKHDRYKQNAVCFATTDGQVFAEPNKNDAMNHQASLKDSKGKVVEYKNPNVGKLSADAEDTDPELEELFEELDTRQKELDEKEQEQADKATELETKEQELADKAAAQAETDKELEAKATDLEAREKAVAAAEAKAAKAKK